MADLVQIGLSACMMHPDQERAIFKGKRLLYCEESMAHYVVRHGAMPMLIPTAIDEDIDMGVYLQHLDGLLLTGGVDVAPASYGEVPLREEWAGDSTRDAYEIAIVQAALRMHMPILGICRGIQLINVALGGTLYQDIEHQLDDALIHRDWSIYDQNFHEITIDSEQPLAQLFPGIVHATVNSVHHQSIKALGENLVVEARSSRDQIIEAVSLQSSDANPHYCRGVQWHPEFQDIHDPSLLDPAPIIQDFLMAAERYKRNKQGSDRA